MEIFKQPIESLNKLQPADFIAATNILFETAPPLVDALLAARPFQSHEHLIDTAQAIIQNFPLSHKIDVVNAHPRIGANKTSLSALSYNEQGYASANAASEAEDAVNARLSELNGLYEDKFGFKFVVFVDGRSRKEIIPVLEYRIMGSKENELRVGLESMILIARDRLKKLKS